MNEEKKDADKEADEREAQLIGNIGHDAKKAFRRGKAVKFFSQWGSSVRRERRRDLNPLPSPYYHSVWIGGREAWKNADTPGEEELSALEHVEENMREFADRENYRIVLDVLTDIATRHKLDIQEVGLDDDTLDNGKSIYIKPPDVYHRILVRYREKSVSLPASKVTAASSYEREWISAHFELLDEDFTKATIEELIE